MKKKIILSESARENLERGIETLAKSVTSTLGPFGRNVIIEQENGENPISTKDGVTVAKSINLEDPVENIGAQLVKQASIKTADNAGDGTTTSTLLAYEIFKRSRKHLAERSVNSVELKRNIEEATKKVISFLKETALDIKDSSELTRIATISANGDESIGNLVSTALDKVGTDGIVTVEESKTGETYLETVEGMQFDRGFKSPYFVTDNNSMQAVLKSPKIIIVDKRIKQVKSLLPILEQISSQNKSLLIIAEDIDGEALSTLVVNKMRGTLNVCAVKAPGFGDRRKEMLEDIAVLTGGTVVSEERGMKLDKFNLDWLGEANKVTVGKEKTTIVGASGDENNIVGRVVEIKNQIEDSTSPFEKEQLQDRLGRLSGGVSVIYVGGLTEVELLEKKDRVEDALHATKAAIEEGILPGGGIALLHSRQVLDSNLNLGEKILSYVLSQPFVKILENAGIKSTVIEDLRSTIADTPYDNWTGVNIEKLEIVDMKDFGVIDPLKVVRMALENAVSVAGTLLITESVVFNVEEGKKEETSLNNFM